MKRAAMEYPQDQGQQRDKRKKMENRSDINQPLKINTSDIVSMCT